MKDFNSIDEILDFAIQNEQNAVDFYTELAFSARSDDMKETFETFAQEEIGHKSRLMKIKTDGVFDLQEGEVLDLKISDYLVGTKSNENLSYEQALILAMKREKSAFRLYTKLAEQAPTNELKKIFSSLALEESRHKLRFEVEYDEYVLKEN
ncbi:MAG: ferritin family protein [Bacteroidetes bacterium]|nr:ferritin family protein [Bacteroidota bacterium]